MKKIHFSLLNMKKIGDWKIKRTTTTVQGKNSVGGSNLKSSYVLSTTSELYSKKAKSAYFISKATVAVIEYGFISE